MLTVWKCPKCGILNKLGEDNNCSNSDAKICNFNIEDGDYELDISEATDVELNNLREEWKVQHDSKKKKEEEEKGPGSDDWDCDNCKHRNKMDLSHIRSAKCKQCGIKNEVIYYMIEASMNKDIKRQERIELDAYNK